MRYEELNSRALAEGGYDRAIVPLGSCESHGAHLPFGTDTMIAWDLARAVAERLERTLVLPPLWFGMSHHYRHERMAISLSADTLTNVVGDVLQSLALGGVRDVIVVNGHDGNLPSLEIAARKARLAHPELRIAALASWWTTAIKLLPRGTFGVHDGLGHGGEGETSLALEIFPHLVDLARARGTLPRTDRHVTQYWDFSELTDCGATGNPGLANREKGARMKQALVDYLVEFAGRMARSGWSYRDGEG